MRLVAVVALLACACGSASDGGHRGDGGASSLGGVGNLAPSSGGGGQAHGGESPNPGVAGLPIDMACDANVACPAEPPAVGAACDWCADVDCAYDRCESDGVALHVHCANGQSQHGAVACGSCCDTDADCDFQVCVQQKCITIPAGACARDADCASDQRCAGDFVCPCRMNCDVPDTLGACVPKATTCCSSEADCDAGDSCVAGGCREPGDASACWTRADCPAGEQCTAVVCACGTSCGQPETRGVCFGAD